MTTDERESLINDICMYLTPENGNLPELKNALYIICNKYEITSRCTELSEVKEDRNENLLKRFLIAKTVKGCTGKTISAYKNGLGLILREIGKTVDDITADDIRYYLAIRQKRDGISKVTADTELRYLRTFYQYLVAEELVAKNPTAKVDRIKCERRKKEAFTDIEIEKIRMEAHGERERAIIETLLSTGCRVSELTQMRIDEIEGNKMIVHGKGEKDRMVYLNARAELAIKVYLEKRTDMNPYLWPGGKWEAAANKSRGVPEKMRDWWKDPENVTKDTHIDNGTIEAMMRRIAKHAGIEKANPHKFRRTCATMALRRGMPIEQVSKMLGHEEITTTQIYLDLSESELEQAHRKYVV